MKAPPRDVGVASGCTTAGDQAVDHRPLLLQLSSQMGNAVRLQ